MAFFSGAFRGFATPREGRSPKARKEANFQPQTERPTFIAKGQPSFMKERGPLTAKKGIANHHWIKKKPSPRKKGELTHHLEKEGAKPTPKRQDQFPPEEWQANPNLEKEGSNTNPERQEQPSLRGQVQEEPSPHSKKAWRTSSTARKGQFPPTKPIPTKEAPTTTPKREGDPPQQEGRGHHHREKHGQGQPKTREGRASPHPRKKAQTPTTRRKGQPPHPEKGGAKKWGQKFTPQERKGQLPHQKDKTNSHLKNDNHKKEGGKPQPREGMANPFHSKKGQPQPRRSKHNLKKANNHTPRRQGWPEPPEGSGKQQPREGRANHQPREPEDQSPRRAKPPL